MLVAPVADARQVARAARAHITPEEWEADMSMRMGEHAYLGGNITGALESFQDAADKDPRRAEAHWRVSHCLAMMDRLPESRAALERARSLAPYDARILNTLAVVQMKSKQPRAAIETARRAVRYAPRVADVWDTLGWSYYQIDDHEHARQAFETALRLDPGHAAALQGLEQVKKR